MQFILCFRANEFLLFLKVMAKGHRRMEGFEFSGSWLDGFEFYNPHGRDTRENNFLLHFYRFNKLYLAAKE